MKYNIGERYKGANEKWFTITGILNKQLSREKTFDSGYKTIASISNIPRGTIKDWLSPSVCDVGIVGEPNMRYHPLYIKWKNMINRCYNRNNPNYPLYGGAGVKVSDELLNFCNYVKVVEKLENYDKLLKEHGKWQIDKDLKSVGQKIYSKETLTIMTVAENQNLAMLEFHKNIYQFDLNGNFIKKYNSLLEVYQENGFDMSGINHAISGRYRYSHNYIWLDENTLCELNERIKRANEPKKTSSKIVIQIDKKQVK